MKSLNLFKKINVFYKSRKELDNLCGRDETAHQGLVAEVEQLEEIKESIAIGQSWNNDVRIILFIVLNQGYKINDEIKDKIKKAIKSKTSPRHVPSKIISILDIPKTKNGKLVELAVKQTVEGEKIKNLEALANPDSLKQFRNIKEINE